MTALLGSVVDDLERETIHLAARLGARPFRTTGATGVLVPGEPTTVWVHGAVDEGRLAPALLADGALPDLHVAQQIQLDETVLQAAGWRPDGAFERWRRNVSATWPPTGAAGRPATPRDLDGVRALQDRCFGTDDADEYLPDDVLDVPGLHLRVLDDGSGAPVAACGVRLRHEGALVFGLVVRPDRRRSGRATGLVRACAEWAAVHGATYVLADVDVPAPALWRRLGFRPLDGWRRYLLAA